MATTCNRHVIDWFVSGYNALRRCWILVCMCKSDCRRLCMCADLMDRLLRGQCSHEHLPPPTPRWQILARSPQISLPSFYQSCDLLYEHTGVRTPVEEYETTRAARMHPRGGPRSSPYPLPPRYFNYMWLWSYNQESNHSFYIQILIFHSWHQLRTVSSRKGDQDGNQYPSASWPPCHRTGPSIYHQVRNNVHFAQFAVS